MHLIRVELHQEVTSKTSRNSYPSQTECDLIIERHDFRHLNITTSPMQIKYECLVTALDMSAGLLVRITLSWCGGSAVYY
jgi:hypothetical protein